MASHPNSSIVKYLYEGFTEGFRLGYSGPRRFRSCKNLQSAVVHPEVATKNINEELAANRLKGPFDFPPFSNLQCSPMGVVEKKYSENSVKKYRTIYHLSYPPEDGINDYISKEDFSLSYVTLDDAVAIVQKLGRGCLMAKTDIKSAFRVIPIHPVDHELLGIFWDGKYYYDTCLCFGLRSAPKIFDTFSSMLEWIGKHKCGITNLIHILDDFFTAGVAKTTECHDNITRLINLFVSLGVPLVADKTVGPCSRIQFLGILIDSDKQSCELPQDKLNRLRVELSKWQSKKKASLRELQSLLGLLSFACRVIRPGRTLLRSIIELCKKLKRPYHQIRLNKCLKADLAIWSIFLRNWNGISYFPSQAPTEPFGIYTDASGSIGFAGAYQSEWFALKWPTNFRLSDRKTNDSIALREMIPVVIACLTWAKQLSRKTITLFCDNESVVNIINSRRSRVVVLNRLLRTLVLSELSNDYSVSATHIPTEENVVADSLSRLDFQRFRLASPSANTFPTTIPTAVLTRVWSDVTYGSKGLSSSKSQ
jgi:hypothetical protein